MLVLVHNYRKKGELTIFTIIIYYAYTYSYYMDLAPPDARPCTFRKKVSLKQLTIFTIIIYYAYMYSYYMDLAPLMLVLVAICRKKVSLKQLKIFTIIIYYAYMYSYYMDIASLMLVLVHVEKKGEPETINNIYSFKKSHANSGHETLYLSIIYKMHSLELSITFADL